jgi:photosystem II stability/assembly factor-like uncharacterized protein
MFSIFIVILLLAEFIPPNTSAYAATGAAKWTGVNLPAGGAAGGWVLADGSDIQHLIAAVDGTLYAYGRGLPNTLYKSTDGGLKWAYIGQVQTAITGIAVSPHDLNTVYYATLSSVYRSTNGGKTFMQTLATPEGAGSGNIEITSISVTWLNDDIVAVSTRDTDTAQYGGVYILEEANAFAGWIDTGIGGYDVYTVAFSPNYVIDQQISAVATDEIDTFVMSKIGNSDWSGLIGYARLDRDNSGIPTPIAVTQTAAIAFPGNYNGITSTTNRIFYVGIDTGTSNGDVYKINCRDAPGISLATDLNIGRAYGENNIDITGLAAYGNNSTVILAAGAADSSRTFISRDGGTSWTLSTKTPTGDSATCVLFSPDFAATGRMYAATSGSGSALSISRDIGANWNQVSFIDTTIGSIIDLAPSPDYRQDNTLFLLTSGGADSLWRSQNSGDNWERIFSSDCSGVDGLNLIILPPQYGVNSWQVLTAGTSSGNPALWESNDNGQSYTVRLTHDPATSAAFSIDTWAMAGDNTLYIGSYDGTHGTIHQTSNGGFFYSQATPVGNNPLYTIALSPDFENDGNILAGDSYGWIYWSNDKGASFLPLPIDATLPPLTGNVAVAFDPGFKTNHIIYATDDTTNKGIYRFTMGQSATWENIDATLPAAATVNQLSVSGNGVLYAANSHINGGMERSLDPECADGPSFETVTNGLSTGAILSGLWQRDCRLWTIDTANAKLMTYNDILALPTVPVSPANGAASIGSLTDHTVKNVNIDWETLDGTTSYEWQCSLDTDFSSIPAGFTDTTSASYARLPALDPATIYYWRVRAGAPVKSPWSPKWSFTTSLDTEIVTLKPEIPTVGAAGVPLKPIFQWTAVSGADAYELLAATDADFSHPVIVKINDYSLPTNTWQCDVSLDYSTTYYWKVRASASGTTSAWSSASVFTTESPPSMTTEPAVSTPLESQNPITLLTSPKDNISQATTPAPQLILPPALPAATSSIQSSASIQLTNIPVWIIYLIGALLVIVVLALIIVLTVVLKIRRF